jgi:hypothetical protein
MTLPSERTRSKVIKTAEPHLITDLSAVDGLNRSNNPGSFRPSLTFAQSLFPCSGFQLLGSTAGLSEKIPIININHKQYPVSISKK